MSTSFIFRLFIITDTYGFVCPCWGSSGSDLSSHIENVVHWLVFYGNTVHGLVLNIACSTAMMVVLTFGQCIHFDLSIFKVDIEINGPFLLPDKPPAEVLHGEVSGTGVTIRGIRTVSQFLDMAMWYCLLLVESYYVTGLFMIMLIIPEASRLYLVDRKLLLDPLIIWLLSITEFRMYNGRF